MSPGTRRPIADKEERNYGLGLALTLYERHERLVILLFGEELFLETNLEQRLRSQIRARLVGESVKWSGL